MSQSVSVRIRKDNAMKALRRRLPDAFAANLATATEASGAEMVALAKSLVPTESGELKDSIVLTKAGERTPAYSQPGGAATVPVGAVMVTAGNSKARYPHLVEYGTREHDTASKKDLSHKVHHAPPPKKHPGTKPRPYFWPSYRLVRKKFASRATREINKAIKKVSTSK